MEESAAESNITVVFMSSPAIPAIEDINAYLCEAWPGYPGITKITRQSADEIAFQVGKDLRGVISLVRRPYPRESILEAAERAWWWPDAAKTLENEEGHLALSLDGGDDAYGRFFCLTYLSAAISVLSESLGVLWGSSGMLHAGNEFSLTAEEVLDEDPPIPLSLWVDFQLCEGSKSGTTSLYSTGLEPLGYPELEIHDSEAPPDDMLHTARMVGLYMLAASVIPADGDTIGMGDARGITIHTGPSLVHPEQTVLLLEV